MVADVNWDVWQREYERLLQSRSTLSEPGPAQHERRRHPRFSLTSGFVTVHVQPRFQVADLSVTGIAFLSEIPFRSGTDLELVLEKAFAVPATVVGCELVESDPLLLEVRYHVGCRFHDQQDGMQFLVMATELDRVQVVQSPPG